MFPRLENAEELSTTVKESFLKQNLDFKLEYVRGTASKFKSIILSKITNRNVLADRSKVPRRTL